MMVETEIKPVQDDPPNDNTNSITDDSGENTTFSSSYRGEVKKGTTIKHGFGTLEYQYSSSTCSPGEDGTQPVSKYVGEWQNGLKHGQGTQTWSTGSKYKGGWISNKRHGLGKYTYADGNTYEGEWVEGLKQGHGTFVWSSSGSKYIGQWVGDLRHGRGVLIYANGRKYDGGWEKNKKHGKGIVTNEDGNSYIGHYVNGKKVRQQYQRYTTKEEDEGLLKPPTNGFYIKYAPDKSMTGVDETMTRLCASIAGQIYSSSKAEDFNLCIGNIIDAEVIHFEIHGDPYGGVTPDIVVVVSGSTMILGWQGSTTVMDFIVDFDMVPITSCRWSNISKEIKVHAGFVSIVENDLSCLGPNLIKKMKEYNINELIMTGHSLGGASAQVAHLCVQAALHDENSIWSQYKKNIEETFSVRNIAFSAPMSISTIVSSASARTIEFLKEIAANSCNIIYNLDIIPRGFSQLTFIDLALTNIIEGTDDAEIFAKFNLPQAASIFVNLREIILKQYEGVKQNELLEPIIEVAKTFNHYGNIIHYKNDTSRPAMYRDFNHDQTSCDKKFSDLKWVPQDISMDLIGNLTHDHNNTVRGPGLAYNIPYNVSEKDPGGLTAKCYMMDEFEVLKNFNDVSSIPFTDFDDCVKKAKEAMHTASYAAVAVWEKRQNGKEKFKNPGTLYIKKCVPGISEYAKSVGVGFWNKGSKNKATFWRTACLDDWVKDRESSANIHDGVVELK